MYIRWERRRHADYTKYGSPPPGHTLIARLVESRRVDGKPRQRHVAYLGGILSDRLDDAYAGAAADSLRTAAAVG